MTGSKEGLDAYFARELPPEGVVTGSGRWYELDAIDPVEFIPGLRFRPVLGERVLVNFVTYEPGTVVPEHSHEEEQVTFVLEGEFEFALAGEKRLLKPGMVAHIPPHVPHAARTLESGCVQVDVFAPPRRVLVAAMDAAAAAGE